MDLKFESCSDFIEAVTTKGSADDWVDKRLNVQFKSADSILDLFTLGRLIAFLCYLSEEHEIVTHFAFPNPGKSTVRVKHLWELGFFDFCAQHLFLQHNMAVRLESEPDMFPNFVSAVLDRKAYWTCLLPLREYTIEDATLESEMESQVRAIVRDISGTIRKAFERMQIPHEKLGMELSYMLHTCIRELVSNTVMHSDQTSFFCAITLSRETGKNTRPHRPGVESEVGAHTYDILVMDLGQGVLRSAQNAFGLEFLAPESDYFKAVPWRSDFKGDQARERRLLESLFKNDLVIRRGRRSEGLSEVAKAAQWFGGAFHYRTGRTSLVVAGTGMELAIKETVRKKGPYFTPGIVAAFSLPSPQLQQVTMGLHCQKLTASPLRQQERPAQVHCALPAPSGLFGGAGNFPIRRRSELDAADIQDRLRRLEKPGQVLQIDIRLSDGLDTHFFDSLLQELTKRVRLADLRRAHHMLGRLLFTNVPRRVVNALRGGNCAAFMLFKSTFAILLDESDQPHFIGVTRLSKASNDLAECLLLIWNAHAISENELIAKLKPDVATLMRLQNIVPQDEGSILWWKDTDQGVVYYSLDIQRSLSRERRQRISVADAYTVEGTPAGLQLLNGSIVDSVVDFGLFWSGENCALECGKELLQVSPFPAVDTIVSFMNNGERLALAIQRLTNATSLIVVDPKSPINWDILDASAECIVVVDAIYPGDETGYIAEFVNEARIPRHPEPVRKLHDGTLSVVKIYACADFTNGAAKDNSIAGVRVFSVPDALKRKPLVINPARSASLIQLGQKYLLPKPIRQETLHGNDTLTGRRFPEYAPIELSTEFWHNVSELKIVSAKRTGREQRSVLFYENNERILQHPRTRSHLQRTLGEYVRNILELNVDVILHPSHTVGATLAQMVASILALKVMTFPLAQRRYGGKIEPTEQDYRYMQRLTDSIRAPGRQLRALVLDDSVITGQSLFTMLGIGHRVGVRVVGIFVLLNRLTPEVSDALSQHGIHFGYLYRLHMPLLAGDDSPDEEIKRLNAEVASNVSSVLCARWCARLASEESHFLSDVKGIDEDCPRLPSGCAIPPEDGGIIEVHKLDHLLNGLILHPDPRILDFFTRVGIAYNFFEVLSACESFWTMLAGMYDAVMQADGAAIDETASTDDAENRESVASPPGQAQSIAFIRKVVYFAAFSRHVFVRPHFGKFENFCHELLQKAFANEGWLGDHELITECLMALGIIGSEKLAVIVETHGRTIAAAAAPAIDIADGRAHGDRSASAARSIAGAAAWALTVSSRRWKSRPLSLRNGADVEPPRHTVPSDVMLIDMLETKLLDDKGLRGSLGIQDWRDSEEVLRNLACRDDAPFTFLASAPGYTCTLKCALTICKAVTVLLYAKNDADSHYYLWDSQTVGDRVPIEEYGSSFLDSGALKKYGIERCMLERVSFVTESTGVCDFADSFAWKRKHRWCFGGAVHVENAFPRSPAEYYVIVAHTSDPTDHDKQVTAYYYWLKYERLLREILPSIHIKYFTSSSSWITRVLAFRTMHAMRYGGNYVQRTLRYAQGNLDPRSLIQRTVRMSRDPIGTIQGVNKQVDDILVNLSKAVLDVESNLCGAGADGGPVAAMLRERMQKDYCDGSSGELAGISFSFPREAVEFIGYEMLCNAISHGCGTIILRTRILRNADGDATRGITIAIEVENGPPHNPSAHGTGIGACKSLADSVGGRFESGPVDGIGWHAQLILFGYEVPAQLRKALYYELH